MLSTELKLIKYKVISKIRNSPPGVVLKLKINITDRFAQINVISNPFHFLVRDTNHPAPPGSGGRLIPCLLPRQEGRLTSDLIQKASILIAGFASGKILIALSFDDLIISDDNGQFSWPLLKQICRNKDSLLNYLSLIHI